MWDLGNLASLLTGSYKKATNARSRFPEAASYEKGFARHYQIKVLPHVAEYEVARLSALKSASFRFRICLPALAIIIPLLLIFWMPTLTDKDAVLFPIVLLVSGASYAIYHPISRYKANVKAKVFPDIISFLGEFSYRPECKGRIKAFEPTGLVPNFDKEQSEDEIQGFYKGVEVDFFETELKKRTRDSKGRTKYTTVFDGVFISLSFNKNFSGRTVIHNDGGTIGNWFKKTFSDLEQVALEDPEFEKIFEVYSSDQIEARYLLTPAFMQRLKNLVDNFGGSKLECCFYQNMLVIKMRVRENLFEPGSIFKPEDFIDDSRRVLSDMQHIFAIVDTLKLDENTGL